MAAGVMFCANGQTANRFLHPLSPIAFKPLFKLTVSGGIRMIRRPCGAGLAWRGVAQSGSASALGAEGRGFESLRPDHFYGNDARAQYYRDKFLISTRKQHYSSLA